MRILIFLWLISGFCRAQTVANSADSAERTGSGKGHRLYYARCEQHGIRFFASGDGGTSWRSGLIDLSAMNFRPRGNPFTACDTSGGTFTGRIYICWSDEKNGGRRNEDIYLVYSDDEGKNWTEPVLVSYWPNHRRQWKPFMKTDPRNGDVLIAFYDGRYNLDESLLDVSLAVSKNGGLKFDIFRMNAFPLRKESEGPRLKGSGNLSCCWKDRRTEHCTDVNDTVLSMITALNSVNELQIEKSFTFSPKISINFKTNTELRMDASLTKPLEPGFEKVLFKKKRYAPGGHALRVDTEKLGLQKGSYILTLYFNCKSTYCWIIEE